MRIQHNIMSMNAYRNYNTNTSALSRNLEKLSSGYRINRAGDDAAGLAISEKMRAQITGLETAGKNVKDGVSLVKTAEGAMQEVQDMLNRMVELATQSANGTYDNEVDRNNLQQEVDRLKEEIDRIADSANFNGIKLLDGSMTSDGTVAINVQGGTQATIAATASKSVVDGLAVANSIGAGANLKASFALDDGTSINVELELSADKSTIIDKATGKTYKATANQTTQDELNAALKGAIEDASNGKFTVSISAAGAATLESTQKGEKAPTVTAASATKGNQAIAAVKVNGVPTKGTAQKINVSGVTAVNGTGTVADANRFSINGQKFVLAKTDADAKLIRDAGIGNDVTIVIGETLDKAANQIAAATGLDIEGVATAAGGAAATSISISVASGKELSLQIGDTSEKYNQMEVGIQDMHVAALGIGGISIAQQTDAQAAVKTIKDAINKVSSVRGTLGATQNRLEHTQKNLSVMQENIQDAESTIRDTDVAAEMMAYTKNNILVQSAQAMLAQANQVPQGVLQLLQ